MKAESNPQKINIATVFFIGVLAWAISNTGHEILGHGLASVLLGYESLGVSTSFFLFDDSNVLFWDDKLIIVGGTLFNIFLAIGAYYLLTKRNQASIHTIYFLWVLLNFNLFYSGSYVMGWFFGPTLDSALFMVGFDSIETLKVVLTLVGFSIVLLALHICSNTLHFVVDMHAENPGRKISVLTFYPYLAAIVLKVSAGLMNPSDELMLIVLGSFGATGFFLIWMNLVRFWPYRQVVNLNAPYISLNYKWIVSGIVAFLLFVFVLGAGIGEAY